MNTAIIRKVLLLLLGIGAYYALKLFIPFGSTILYPFQLLATILHEFGHAAFTLLTGGDVHSVQINMDGSGVTSSSGGWRLFIIAGGYLGSAIFGNILLHAGIVHSQWSKQVLAVLLVIMVAIATIWSSSIGNTIFVSIFALAVYIISRLSSEVAAVFLTFMGALSLLYIIEDFNNGPTSDLAQFTNLLPFLPFRVWMFAWLAAVVAMTWWNVKGILRSNE